MYNRRRNLLATEKVWYLLFAGTTVYNASSGGYIDTTYVWTTLQLSNLVGPSSPYYFKLIEEYDTDLGSILQMIIEIKKRDGTVFPDSESELAVTYSPLEPPGQGVSGQRWVVIKGEEVLQSNGINSSSITNMTSDSLGYYLNSEGMAEAEWTWNYFPNGGGSEGGSSDNCPEGGNHSWKGMEQTGNVNCPYEGEITSCTRYQCEKCGTNKWVYHCGHGD